MAECKWCQMYLEDFGYKITAFDNTTGDRDTEYYCSSSCMMSAYGKFYTRWEMLRKVFR